MDLPVENRPPLILIVDDDPVVRSLMRTVLENGGFEVVDASDGEEACFCCEQSQPDLLVVDVVMPGMDGFALCRELRQRRAWAYTPILVATGLDDMDSVAEAYDAGATDFISKPINWLILLHRVRYMLRAGRAAEDLHQNQLRLIAARDAAEAANRAKTEFLANMSHELRTPLHAIIGFSTIMRDASFDALADNYVEYSTAIAESGTHLLKVINDILDIAQAEANTLTVAWQAVQIERVVALSSRLIADIAQKAGVDYCAEIDENLPVLYADAGKLQKILINLLSNAVKFTSAGGRVRLKVSNDAGNAIVFRIEDSGIGMAKDKVSIALAPFGQLDSGTARKYDGAGLGLPLTKRLIELHGGSMEIQSTPGIGTVVTASFPTRRHSETVL